MTFTFKDLVTLAVVLAWTANVEATHLSTPPMFDLPLATTGDAKGFGYVVEVRLNGRPAHLVVDTGSAPTILMHWFATHRGTKRDPCARDLDIQLGEAGVRRTCFTAMSIPEFESAGLAGLLSPQDLLPLGWVVVDFSRSRLTGFESVSAFQSDDVLKEHFPGRKFQKIERLGQGIGAVLLRASYGSRPPTIVDVDSGTPFTKFSAGYLGARTGAGESLVNVTGPTHTVRSSNGIETLNLDSLSLGDVEVKSNDQESDVVGIALSGSLGIDALRHCALAFPPRAVRAVYLSCDVPVGFERK